MKKKRKNTKFKNIYFLGSPEDMEPIFLSVIVLLTGCKSFVLFNLLTKKLHFHTNHLGQFHSF